MSSVSVAWLSPVGTSLDPEGAAGEGESAVCAELLLRGTERSTSAQMAQRLDALGVQRNSSAAVYHTNLCAVTTAPNTPGMLACMGEMVRTPRMDDDGVASAKALALQAIAAVRDDPQHVCMQNLQRVSMPAPYNRSGLGTAEGVEALTPEGLRRAWRTRCTPVGTVIGIAGAVDHQVAVDALEQALEGWSGTAAEPPGGSPVRGERHFEAMPTSQTHLALSLEAPNALNDDRHAMRLAARILGGGSSSRLFDEVRERRGLCYSVGASYTAGRRAGQVIAYAGSRPERAQETLDCILRELARFEQGVEDDEVERARIGLLSRLVMAEESTGARAMALATDWFTYGHLRTVEESAAALRSVTRERINAFLAERCGASWREGLCRAVVAPTDLQ